MNVKISEGPVVFLPIYSLNQAPDSNWVYWLFRSFELLLHVPTFILTLFVIRLASKSRIFHINMTIIIMVFSAKWIECMIARFSILPFQEGFVRVGVPCKASVPPGLLPIPPQEG
ncbi:unnamed protein product [Caenorhabditis auriculariae]|uniref:Uncharacterized protein n=1 Tax=Caenorhabditis auriculariae TaxID=2777116 RepID=A0A8S1HI60_9PELO|nr:unnamed protein product [Caenorhabditis auriculariae]